MAWRGVRRVIVALRYFRPMAFRVVARGVVFIDLAQDIRGGDIGEGNDPATMLFDGHCQIN